MTTAPIRTPDGVTLTILPDGRTLVRDGNVPTDAPLRTRYVVLRPGWQDVLESWRPDILRYRHSPRMYAISWWTALASGGACDDVGDEALTRLVTVTGRQ